MSSLDISIQAQIIHLFRELQKRYNLSLIYISHDLNVVWYLSDYIVILLGGIIVEKAPKRTLSAPPPSLYKGAFINGLNWT